MGAVREGKARQLHNQRAQGAAARKGKRDTFESHLPYPSVSHRGHAPLASSAPGCATTPRRREDLCDGHRPSKGKPLPHPRPGAGHPPSACGSAACFLHPSVTILIRSRPNPSSSTDSSPSTTTSIAAWDTPVKKDPSRQRKPHGRIPYLTPVSSAAPGWNSIDRLSDLATAEPAHRLPLLFVVEAEILPLLLPDLAQTSDAPTLSGRR